MKILSLFSLLFLLSCDLSKNEKQKQEKSLSNDVGFDYYTKFDFGNPKAIVMNCQKGRVKARIKYYETTAVEVHKSFLKYVNFEPKGDTLFINTTNWPSENKGIKKQINIYLPDLDYLETQLTSFTILGFNTHKLEVKSENAAFRLSQCKIENFKITVNERSNMYVDSYCAVDFVDANCDKSSLLSFYGHVYKDFKLKCPNLDNIRLGNVHSSIFKWTK